MVAREKGPGHVTAIVATIRKRRKLERRHERPIPGKSSRATRGPAQTGYVGAPRARQTSVGQRVRFVAMTVPSRRGGRRNPDVCRVEPKAVVPGRRGFRPARAQSGPLDSRRPRPSSAAGTPPSSRTPPWATRRPESTQAPRGCHVGARAKDARAGNDSGARTLAGTATGRKWRAMAKESAGERRARGRRAVLAPAPRTGLSSFVIVGAKSRVWFREVARAPARSR